MRSIQLKIKLKSLAAESKIIRNEERRLKTSGRGPDTMSLRIHRVEIVRRHSRLTHLAYGYLLGRSYKQIEQTTKTPIQSSGFKEIAKMVQRYSHKRTEPQDIEKWIEAGDSVAEAA